VRVVAVAPDVLVATSAYWQTTCTIVRRGDEGFVIDSPVLPDELDALPAVVEQAGFPFTGLLATHGDWDHLLGRMAWPDAALGVAESTAQRLRAEPGAAARELREFDDQNYIVRPRPLQLGAVQELPVPGRCEVGDAELELHPTGGHTVDGMAIVVPWAGVLVLGDHLSPVEIPWISDGGSREVYLDTLARLEPLVAAAETVVPGHGGPITPERALALLAEDREYLEALPGGAKLPEGRRDQAQAKIHSENVFRLTRNDPVLVRPGGPDPADPGPPIGVRLDEMALGDLGHARTDSRLAQAILLRDKRFAAWLRERGVTAEAIEDDFPGSRWERQTP